MRSSSRKILALGVSAILAAGTVSMAGAQTSSGQSSSGGSSQGSSSGQSSSGSEKTVEEAYLQESLETMIINEESLADSRDQKMKALDGIKAAVDAGRQNAGMEKSLEYLALENSYTVSKSAGLGAATNDFPDVRAKACNYLGGFDSDEARKTLVKVALGDRESMVVGAAIHSLGKMGNNENGEVEQTISYIVTKYDVLQPDNALAHECIVALDRIADGGDGITDPSTIRAIMKIATGTYMKVVRDEASALLRKLMENSAKNSNSTSGSSSSSSSSSSTGSNGKKK